MDGPRGDLDRLACIAQTKATIAGYAYQQLGVVGQVSPPGVVSVAIHNSRVFLDLFFMLWLSCMSARGPNGPLGCPRFG